MKDLRITTGVAAALLAAPLAACGQQDNGWTADRDTAVCVDQQGHRVTDDKCPQQRHVGSPGIGSAFLWYYLGRQSAVPYYGQPVRGGSFAPMAGHSYFRAPVSVSRAGAISRGGFGSLARGGGGAGE